jgi:hypothetical protein
VTFGDFGIGADLLCNLDGFSFFKLFQSRSVLSNFIEPPIDVSTTIPFFFVRSGNQQRGYPTTLIG